MMDIANCIEIVNLSKTFKIAEKGISIKEKLSTFWGGNLLVVKALNNIKLEVKKGEFLGIMGKNGSGKSTLLKIILGVIDPDDGSSIRTDGKIIRLALGMGFDLNLSARDNIYLNGTILGLSFKEIGEKFDDIINFAELQKFVNTPVKYFSSGMKSRLSFAIAMQAEAEIFLIDEFFADVGDDAFKEKSQRAFEEKMKNGKTIIHVSHSVELLKKHCQRVYLIHEGEGRMYDDIDAALQVYQSY